MVVLVEDLSVFSIIPKIHIYMSYINTYALNKVDSVYA